MKIEATFGRSEQKGAYVSILIREAPEGSKDIYLCLNDRELEKKIHLFSPEEIESIVKQCQQIIDATSEYTCPFAYKALFDQIKKVMSKKYDY